MKIRTDFVTNSSSSSFVAYKAKGELINKFAEQFGIDFEYDENVHSSVDGDKLNINIEECLDLIPLSHLMICAISDTNYNAICKVEFDNIRDKWCELANEKKLKKRPKTAYEDYDFANDYDGSFKSAVEIVYELFANTDFKSRVDIESYYEFGGSEWTGDLHDEICNFYSTGEKFRKNNKDKLIEYAAHPCFGGFSFIDDEEYFYVHYVDKQLTLRDVEADYDDWNVSFENKDIDNAIKNVIKKGTGLEKIKEISCEKVTEISLPKSVSEICDNAFEKCKFLKKLTINRKKVTIGKNAIPDGVVIVGMKGGSAEKFANENGYEFEVISS